MAGPREPADLQDLTTIGMTTLPRWKRMWFSRLQPTNLENDCKENDMTTDLGLTISRREALQRSACGFGSLALAALGANHLPAAESPLAAKQPHFPARAKRVIFLYMDGGPSQVDTFDYKPELQKSNGNKIPFEQPANGKTGNNDSVLFASPWKFQQHGESGLWISDNFPHLAKHADDLCLINSMHHETAAHAAGVMLTHTGEFRFPRPSIGSWVAYGLGTESENLPAFVVINPGDRNETIGAYSNSFLPAVYDATLMRNVGGRDEDVIKFLANARQTRKQQRMQLDLVQELNRDFLARREQDSNIDALIESYERAFRMQTAVPEVTDISGETQNTLDLYGLGGKKKSRFGMQCLMARRLSEAGVRFIEVHHGGWDHHDSLSEKMPSSAAAIDQPIAGLIADLKQRSMLDETLIVWGGEFGRTSAVENMKDKSYGRDHNGAGFTYWLAGGGAKGGIRYGATDEIGWIASENKVHVHDLHATVLHLLGLDHQKLTYRYGGRDYTLTDVDGEVVKDIIA